MLTYDDLDHFDEPALAGLFALPGEAEQAGARQRRERILACLRFCRDVTCENLPEAGVQTARRLLKRVLRNQQRCRRGQPDGIEELLAAALRALGDRGGHQEEAAEVAALRHSVEREIQTAAQTRRPGVTSQPLLLEVLAAGDFEIGASSYVAALDEAIGKFNGHAEIDLELILDGASAATGARIHLAISCGLWRWSVLDGCSIAFDADEPQPLPVGDALLPVLLAGVATQGGRALAIWAQAVRAQPCGHLN